MKNLFSKIEKATDENEHTKAVWLLTDFLGLDDESATLKHIEKEHIQSNSGISDENYNTRWRISKKAHEIFQIKYGKELFDQLRKCY